MVSESHASTYLHILRGILRVPYRGLGMVSGGHLNTDQTHAIAQVSLRPGCGLITSLSEFGVFRAVFARARGAIPSWAQGTLKVTQYAYDSCK